MVTALTNSDSSFHQKTPCYAHELFSGRDWLSYTPRGPLEGLRWVGFLPVGVCGRSLHQRYILWFVRRTIRKHDDAKWLPRFSYRDIPNQMLSRGKAEARKG